MSGRDTGGIGTTDITTAGVGAGGGADFEAEVAEVVSIALRCEAAADSDPHVDEAATDPHVDEAATDPHVDEAAILVATLLGEDPHNMKTKKIVGRIEDLAEKIITKGETDEVVEEIETKTERQILVTKRNPICLPVVLRSRIWAAVRPWGRRVGCRQCNRRPRLRTIA